MLENIKSIQATLLATGFIAERTTHEHVSLSTYPGLCVNTGSSALSLKGVAVQGVLPHSAGTPDLSCAHKGNNQGQQFLTF
jgi:hypothetical protein